MPATMMCSAAVRRQLGEASLWWLADSWPATQRQHKAVARGAGECTKHSAQSLVMQRVFLQSGSALQTPAQPPLPHVPGGLASGETGRPPVIPTDPSTHPSPAKDATGIVVFWNNWRPGGRRTREMQDRVETRHGGFFFLIGLRFAAVTLVEINLTRATSM